MGLAHLPKIVTDGLSFLYDTADNKSYQGEPTTNYGPASFGDWGTEGTAERIATGNTYKGQPTYNCRTEVGLVYKGIDKTVTGLRTAAGSSGTVTMSCMVRNTYPTSYNMSAYIGHDFSGNRAVAANSDWQKVQWTVNQSSMNNDYVEFRPYTNNANIYLEMTMPMVEVNKGHATQFVNGTRSATQGLLDRTKNSTIDISNVSFDSNAQMTFDGTDDYSVIPYSSTDLDGDAIFSVEAVIKRTGAISNAGLWGIGDGTLAGINGYVYPSASNKISIDLWGTASFHTGIDYPLNDYVHVAWVKTTTGFSTSTIIIYVNGVAYTGSNLTIMRGSSHTPNLNTSTTGKGIVIGRVGPSVNNYYAQGEIPLLKVYNRALTAAEVAQNFNAQRSRFEL